jgi:glucose-6-phosphate dehydrogenase assembly protein OpcA
MEDAVTTAQHPLLPNGVDVPFSKIESTLARLAAGGRRRTGGPTRAFTATVVVVGERDRLPDASEALAHLCEAEGVRAILISEGDRTAPTARVTDHAIGISGLAPKYLNNAVAALRLSSLPTAVWWRGGSPEALRDIAALADRLILDVEDPTPAWDVAASIVDRTAVTDLRWTRLTRWRSVLAHLFDLPDVCRKPVRKLSIVASDPFAARLFAGWLRATLQWGPDVAIDLRPSPAMHPRTLLDSVELDAVTQQITVTMRQDRGCLHAEIAGHDASDRIVPLGEGTLTAIIGEELGVRTRDMAFERALAAALEIPAWHV